MIAMKFEPRLSQQRNYEKNALNWKQKPIKPRISYVLKYMTCCYGQKIIL